MTAPVAALTAAAHRAGKRIAETLVADGWDLAFWGMAAMRARAAHVELHGHRASIARGNIADPVSVRFMVATLRETFDAVDAIVHELAPSVATALGRSSSRTLHRHSVNGEGRDEMGPGRSTRTDRPERV